MVKYVILHDVRSHHNVGSIFRTADGAGVAKIFLCGYTPAPVDRFGREVGALKKTSLGATESVGWEHVDDAYGIIHMLKDEGVTIVAVEQTRTSEPISAFTEPEQVAYIFGNEVEGVPEALCELSDQVIELPMLGRKESLNVSVTAGIVLYHGINGTHR